MENKLELVQEEPREIKLQDALQMDVDRLDTLTYNNDELKKFGIVVTTVRDNLKSYIQLLNDIERKALAEQAQKETEPVVSAEAIAEVKRFEEAEQDGNSEA